MKNRKRIIVAFMLVAVMLMGIGYAALTDALDINGTAEVNSGNAQSAFDEDIYFVSAVANDHTTAQRPDFAEVSDSDNDIATFASYNLASRGDKTTFTFTIANDSDLDVTVTPVLVYVGDDAAQATAQQWFNVFSDKNGQPFVIAAGSQETYTVTVELKDTPTLENGELISSSFNIKLTAVSEDNVD